MRSTQDEALADGLRLALDYGEPNKFPWKVLVDNPFSDEDVPSDIAGALHAVAPSAALGGEYIPGDVVLWFSDQRRRMNGLSVRLTGDSDPETTGPGRFPDHDLDALMELVDEDADLDGSSLTRVQD